MGGYTKKCKCLFIQLSWIYIYICNINREFDTNAKEILKFKPGDLIFNPTFFIDNDVIVQSNESESCYMMAKINAEKKTKNWTDFYTNCVHPKLRKIEGGGIVFTLFQIFEVREKNKILNVHIETCLPFMSEPGCETPFTFNMKKFYKYKDSRYITTINDKDFDIFKTTPTYLTGLTKFETYHQFEQWKNRNIQNIFSYIAFIKTTNEFEFSIIDMYLNEYGEITYNSFKERIVMPDAGGKLVEFKLKDLLKCLFPVYVFLTFDYTKLSHETTRTIEGGIFDTTMDDEQNTEEIIKHFQPINIINIMKKNKLIPINKLIVNKYQKDEIIHITKEDMCLIFDLNI